MSNGLAIAATTATLRALLIGKLGIPDVTTRTPDKARDGVTADKQVNLFLYQTAPSAAWRNADMPLQTKPGETGHPPLPLNLFYLLTAYFGDGTKEVESQILLGKAMSVLHDHPLLDNVEIKSVSTGELADSDLHEQIERIRVTLEPLPLEELSKLWTSFQTHFRTSAAYQVSVILIESTRPAKAPLPVLTRGKDDAGVATRPDVESPFPVLFAVTPPNQQASARLDDTVTITGARLDAGTPSVRLDNPHLAGPVQGQISGTPMATEIRIEITNQPADWVAGLYTVAVVLTQGADVRTTNELALTLAPKITNLPFTTARDPQGTADVTLIFVPELRPGQRATLLLGDREVSTTAPAAATGTLTFKVENAPAGKHFVRLRIGGVDSQLVQRLPGQPPAFDGGQMVEIT